MDVQLNPARKTLVVKQLVEYRNTTGNTLQSITFNDWNNAYSSKTSPLAKRFADEYVRAFHLAKDDERGITTILSATTHDGVAVKWQRPEGHPDIVDMELPSPLPSGSSITFLFEYDVKVADSRFTRYGFDDKGNFILRNWFLAPARYENGSFVKYSNENLDDIANDICDYTLNLTIPAGLTVNTDLQQTAKNSSDSGDIYTFSGAGRSDFNLVIETSNTFQVYRNRFVEVATNLKDKRVTDIQKALIADQIIKFTNEHLGEYPHDRILLTQTEYERNPVYGLNQLPFNLSPFPDAFIYELKFLKTYLSVFLRNSLRLDPRKDSYIFDGIQTYLMMKYVEENYPDRTMMGLEWGILKGHHLFRVNYNGQYNYLYLLMARKNLDQPVGDARNTFIKFNEQLAGRYRSGLSFNYLDQYLGNGHFASSLQGFYKYNTGTQANRDDFERFLKSGHDRDIDWFFDTVIETREIIDYQFGAVRRKGDDLEIKVKNNTGTNVPIPVYGLKKNGEVVFKQWLENVATDTTLVIPRQNADRLILNYNKEVPEFNSRNNYRTLDKFIFNKPLKFTFFQDLEDPAYNQVFFVPSLTFNIYDGVSPGLRFHNKSMLEKPFIFDIEPTYSSKTNSLIGDASFMYNQYVREDVSLYNIRYAISGSTYHYAPDAAYVKFSPSLSFRFRDKDLRRNKGQSVMFRHVMVDRETSRYVATTEQNENYSVFNARYSYAEADILRHFSYLTDVQLAGNFGKLAGEFQFRRLFNDNRQVNLRVYAGMFMYRSTNSDFFNFGVSRPNDYLFDYNLYGRSETSGLFSQQYVMAQGGFKSFLKTEDANQWITTVNGSFNIWNWIEVYGDAGFVKNKGKKAEFIYDSGIRLNLVPDYFELYLPVYSGNGLELNDGNYSEKIRFVFTFSPKTLINLFTRKWF